jgi:hypothetical protein
LVLAYSSGKEYISGSQEVGSFSSFGIMAGTLTLLLISTWLIGSGLSVKKAKLNSFSFLKFSIISIVVFLLAVSVDLGSNSKRVYFEVNGVKVPIERCIDGSRFMIPDKNDRTDYCKCIVEKITNDSILKSKYQEQLESNQLVNVIDDISRKKNFDLRECMASVKMKWTMNVVTTMKEEWKTQLKGTDFEKTIDVDVYCDCTIDSYRQLPLDTVLAIGFEKTRTARIIADSCTQKSSN